MIGKDRLDLTCDPPPDLALEIDITSKTQITAYTRLGVPELWVYHNSQFQIYVLESGEYQNTTISPTFLDLPILSWVTEALEQSGTLGRSPALRALRQKIRATLTP